MARGDGERGGRRGERVFEVADNDQLFQKVGPYLQPGCCPLCVGSEGGRRGETGRERLCTDPRSARQEEDHEQKEGKAPVYMIRREKIFFP